jgi:hypothetical protein
MAEEKTTTVVKLNNVRLSFGELLEPTKSIKTDPNAKALYRANFIIDPQSAEGKKAIKAIKAAIAVAEHEENGKTGWYDTISDTKRKCFLAGSEQVDDDGDVRTGYEDMYFIKCTSKNRPALYDRAKNEVPEKEILSVFQNGYRVDAIVAIKATTDKEKGGKGVFAYVNAIRFRAKDQTFGAGKVAADAFDDIEDDDEV